MTTQPSKYESLLRGGSIGRLSLKNRVVMASTVTCLGSDTGAVTDDVIHFYAARAKGGVGLIVVEYAYVDHPLGKRAVTQLRMDDPRFLPGHARLVETIHSYGAKAALQLVHAGRQTARQLTEGQQPVAPSPIPCAGTRAVWGDGAMPRALTKREIQSLVARFASAAYRARQAGYDAVELHGAHGYLLAQFMSPSTNRREDEYGGTLARRMRFPLAVIAAMREQVGRDFPLIFRISAEEYVPNGLRISESQHVVRMLEAAGVDAINVSEGMVEQDAGISRMICPMSFPQGWRIPIARAIKAATSIPIIAVGSFQEPEAAAEAIGRGDIDFAAMSRALIADPEWANKVYADRTAEVRRCIGCNMCIGVLPRSSIRCAVNAVAGRERWMGELSANSESRRVLVIGGGPAGLEAARVAAGRGHSVELHEAGAALGGQLLIAKTGRRKQRLGWLLNFLEGEIQRLGVDVRLNSNVAAHDVIDRGWDSVILASGAREVIRPSPNVGFPRPVTPTSLLVEPRQTAESTEHVVVVGKSGIACEAAEDLASRGLQVWLAADGSEQELATDRYYSNRFELLQLMESAGVRLLLEHQFVRLGMRSVVLAGPGGNRRDLSADVVVMAECRQPAAELIPHLTRLGSAVQLAGDCAELGDIASAIASGALAGRRA